MYQDIVAPENVATGEIFIIRLAYQSIIDRTRRENPLPVEKTPAGF